MPWSENQFCKSPSMIFSCAPCGQQQRNETEFANSVFPCSCNHDVMFASSLSLKCCDPLPPRALIAYFWRNYTLFAFFHTQVSTARTCMARYKIETWQQSVPLSELVHLETLSWPFWFWHNFWQTFRKHFWLHIYFGILPRICSSMGFGILHSIFSDILSGIFFWRFVLQASGIYSEILCGIF